MPIWVFVSLGVVSVKAQERPAHEENAAPEVPAEGSPDEKEPQLTTPPTSTASSSPSEADRKRAIELFQRALQLYEEGDYHAAVFEFEKAYEAAPNYKVLYNIATTYLKVHRYAKAYVAYERYLQDGGKKISEERRKDVSRLLETLKNRVARLTLHVDPSDARVEIDDELIGSKALEKEILVKLGKRRVTVTKPGFAMWSKVVPMAGGQAKVLNIELVPSSTSAETQTEQNNVGKQPLHTKSTKPKRKRKIDRGVIIAAGVGATFLVATAITGGLTLRAQNRLDDARNTFPTDEETLSSRSDKAKRLAIATDTLGGLSLAAGAVALGLFIKNRLASKRSARNDKGALERAKKPQAKVQSVSPTIGQQHLGLALTGSF